MRLESQLINFEVQINPNTKKSKHQTKNKNIANMKLQWEDYKEEREIKNIKSITWMH